MGQLADDQEALIGRTIAGKFAIESFLGKGAMGSVYRARQTALDKLVAIKVLHRDLVSDPAFIARFQREAKAASRLDHPNSVRVLDYGEDGGLCYIAMELLDGRTLFKLIHDGELLASPRIIDLLRQTLAALAVAHDMGVVHRDLKPENIVVLESADDEGGTKEVVKVCDFGIAKIIGSRADVSPARSEKLTGQGSVLGTPEYMSPEQARGEPLDPRSDLYSVGVILYELLTGQTPFNAETALGILLKHIVEAPKPPSEVQSEVDRRLEAICMKAMQKSPDDRYKTARDMRQALTLALEALAPMLSTSPMPLTRPVTASGAFPAAASTAIVTSIDLALTAPTGPKLGAVKFAEGESAPMSRPRASEQLLSSTHPQRRELSKVVIGSLALGAVIAVAVVAFRPHAQTPIVESPPSAAPLSPATTERSSPPPVPVPASVAHDVPHELPTHPSASAASVAAFAFAKPVTSTLHAPPIALPIPSSSATPVAASVGAPATVPPPPGPFDAARVQIGLIKVEHANSADVMNALPVAKFTQCYRDGLRTRGTPVGGPGTLHLVLDHDGVVTEAAFAGSEALAPIGQCIVNSSTGRKVKTTEPGVTSADIDLSFKPE